MGLVSWTFLQAGLLFVLATAACGQPQGSPTAAASNLQEQSIAATASVAAAASPTSVGKETSPLLPSTELLSYRGDSPYTQVDAQYEIFYDPEVWELVNEPDSFRNRLSSLGEPGCIIRLQAGPVGAPQVSRVTLADREWTIYQIGPRILSYSFPVDGYSYIFYVEFPEDHDDAAKSSCQHMAEEVIDTFTLVDSQ